MVTIRERMNSIAGWFFFIVWSLAFCDTIKAQLVFNHCGVKGDAKQKVAQRLNPLKNRFIVPGPEQIDSTISLNAILQPGNDSGRWNSLRAATILGYVVSAHPGGNESCNCHAKQINRRDTHIDIVINPSEAADKRHHMIIEVTPRLRAAMAKNGIDWSTPALQQTIVNHWVKVTGWMFFDAEHTNAAENSTPGGQHNWRATAWEIHPVTALQVVSDPHANPLNQIFRRDLFETHRSSLRNASSP